MGKIHRSGTNKASTRAFRNVGVLEGKALVGILDQSNKDISG